jgi:hypothetical protein
MFHEFLNFTLKELHGALPPRLAGTDDQGRVVLVESSLVKLSIYEKL